VIEPLHDSASRLALGTAQFGLPYGIANTSGQVAMNVGREILFVAREAGLRTIDTAVAYGTSEARLGEIGVEGWCVITKIPRVPPNTQNVTEWVRKTVLGSIERMHLSTLGAVLMHRSSDLLEPYGDEIHDALLKLKDEGRIGKIGISIYDPDELIHLRPQFTFDIVQAPFNVYDRRILTSGLLERLNAEGVEVHVRSSFLQGALLLRATSLPGYFSQWSHLWSAWAEWLSRYRLTPLEACLRFVLCEKRIARAVVGVDSVNQLREILVSLGDQVSVPPDELSTDDPDLINPYRWKNH